MKKSSIFWSVLLIVFCTLAFQFGRASATLPLQFTPNWLTIVPTMATWATLIGVSLRKRFSTVKNRTLAAGLMLRGQVPL